jgi:hypothetical protein
VTHLHDLPLLKLQARSLKCYLDRSLVQDIIVIDNSVGNQSLPRAELRDHYGDLPFRVIKTASLGREPPRAYGWFGQQFCKLLVSQYVRTARYLILDSKNHLIGPLNKVMIEAPDGRIRTGSHPYHHHTLRPYLQRCCDYFRIKPAVVMDRFLPTTPPFIMMTDIVRRLIIDIEKREKRLFADAFRAQGFTEFFLYGTYIIATGHTLDEYYKSDDQMGSALWGHYNNTAMQRIIAHPKPVFFAAHRNTFRNMNAETQHALATFWHERHLFMSYANALRFVKGCAITYHK